MSDDDRDGTGPSSAVISRAASTLTADNSIPRQPRQVVSQQLRDRARYRIIGEHGRGGLGCVSRAHDQELGRDVAIKEVIARDALSEARFVREALITARLEHPGIVPVYEAGRWPDGTPFYAMKLVAGRPLRELIKERATVDERIGLLHHVIAVADAMAYAHDQGIIHRDLKPANVIVGEFGETIVIDWGLAKDLAAPDLALPEGSAPSSSDEGLTSAGSVMGTPAYMAPEQARGENVDQRADVFAIGAMLWELCSLKKVPPGDARVRHRVLRHAGIDGDLITIIDKAVAQDPERRYPHAGALAADLKAFKSGARITARSYSLAATLVHWTRHHRALAVSALAFVVLLAASSVALAVMYRDGLRTQMAKQAADLAMVQAEVEQGRQALIQDDSAEALPHLVEAYRRGERSSGVAFMLARALQSRGTEQARFASMSGRMWSATFSSDGQRVVATDDRGARVWDAQAHKVLFELPHGETVAAAQYSPDGKAIVTAGSDGSVKIWDASSGELLRKLVRARADGKPCRYFRMAISPDGNIIAAADSKGEVVHVWNARNGAALAELGNDGSEFPEIAFSADGHWLAITGGDKVRVFDSRTWAQSTVLAGRRIRTLAFDPTGPRVMTGSALGAATLWEIPSGAKLQAFRETGEPIDALAFSPDGALTVTASRDGTEQIWNARTGQLQSQVSFLRSKIMAIEFNASSTAVLAGGASGIMVVADASSGLPITVLDGPRTAVRSAHFDPSSRRIVAAFTDGTARIWDAASPYHRWRAPPLSDDCDLVTTPDQDRRFVAVSCNPLATRVWDTAHDRLLAELPSIAPLHGDFLPPVPAVSMDGELAAIPRDDAVDIYALPGGQLVRTIPHPAPVTVVAFATTGHDLVSGSVDGSLLVTRDQRAPVAMPAATGGVDAAAFLPDGKVVVADTERRVRTIDPDRAAVLGQVEVPSRMMSLRPSPDGARLLMIPNILVQTTSVTLWDIAHQRQIASLDKHLGRTFSARFVASSQIVTAGGDGTARIWDAATGALRQTYRVGGSWFLSDATLDPTGTIVVAGGADGVLRFWEASSGRLLWTLPAHKSHVIGIHFEGDDLVTRGFGGDVARWALPRPAQVIERLGELTRR